MGGRSVIHTSNSAVNNFQATNQISPNLPHRLEINANYLLPHFIRKIRKARYQPYNHFFTDSTYNTSGLNSWGRLTCQPAFCTLFKWIIKAFIEHTCANFQATCCTRDRKVLRGKKISTWAAIFFIYVLNQPGQKLTGAVSNVTWRLLQIQSVSQFRRFIKSS